MPFSPRLQAQQSEAMAEAREAAAEGEEKARHAGGIRASAKQAAVERREDEASPYQEGAPRSG